MRKEKAKVLSKVCGDLVKEAFRHFDKSVVGAMQPFLLQCEVSFIRRGCGKDKPS